MKWIMYVLAVLTATLYYGSKIDQRSEWAMQLIELETSYGIAFWIPLSILTVIAGFTTRHSGSKPASNSNRNREDWPGREKQFSSPKPTPPPQSPPEQTREDLQSQIKKSIKKMKLPNGAQIKFNLQHRYPLQLQLDRCTPEMTRSALKSFAQFINSLPTPPQIQIIFLDVIDSGIPYSNQVTGAFRAYYHSESLLIRGYEGEVEVRFLLPDVIWSTEI